MTALLVALVSLPCLYWTQGVESRSLLESAGVRRICVPREALNAWKAAGFEASPLSPAEVASREALAVPGISPRAGLASPTRAPWIVANGWRILRAPDRKFVYELPPGKAALAAAEAFAYGADAVLKADAADLAGLGGMLRFLQSLEPADLPPLADIGVVDDGSAITGEVMNLLARRNLLFAIVKAPSPQFPITITIGSPEYPAAEAADPSAFAQKVRRQLTDARRRVRIYGSEVVICRVTGDASRVRLHLLNYGGREIEGLRVRLRGRYVDGVVHTPERPSVGVQEPAAAEGATEFSIARIASYAVVDLKVQ